MALVPKFNYVSEQTTVVPQATDFVFSVEVTDDANQVIDPNTLQEATYTISDPNYVPILSKRLSLNQVAIDNTSLVIHVQDTDLNMYGDFFHQLTVTDANGYKLPPVFLKPLYVSRILLPKTT